MILAKQPAANTPDAPKNLEPTQAKGKYNTNILRNDINADKSGLFSPLKVDEQSDKTPCNP